MFSLTLLEYNPTPVSLMGGENPCSRTITHFFSFSKQYNKTEKKQKRKMETQLKRNTFRGNHTQNFLTYDALDGFVVIFAM